MTVSGDGQSIHFGRIRPTAAGPENASSALAENRLDIVAVRIEDERGVVAARVASRGVAEAWRAIIGPAGLEGGRVESLDFGAAFGLEGGMLLDSMRVEAIKSENGVIEAIADAVVVRKLHDPAKAEGAQSRILKRGGTRDVRDADAWHGRS